MFATKEQLKSLATICEDEVIEGLEINIAEEEYLMTGSERIIAKRRTAYSYDLSQYNSFLVDSKGKIHKRKWEKYE